MLNLRGTTDILELVTASAVTVDVLASWVDLVDAATTASPNSTPTAITLATTTTIVAAAGSATTTRNVKTLNVRNKHASSSNAVTVQVDRSATDYELIKYTLLAGEQLVYADGEGWAVIDANGAMKVNESVSAVATQADMEAGASLITFVTPGRAHFHPSACKAWLVCGITGNILGSYNITSIADTGTGVVTVTIATDFSGTTYAAVAQVQATATTWAVANARECHIRSATIAAGTIAIDCIDNTATTNLVKDPTTWHIAMFGDQA